MKKLISITIPIVITCILFSACQETLTEVRKAEIEKELLDFTYDVMDRFNNRDTATVYTYYSDNFSLMSRGQYRITSPEEFEKMTSTAKVSIATSDKTVFNVENPKVEVYSNNVANITYTYTTTTTFDNDVSYESRSASTWTMIKENGEWKIKHAHISAVKDTYRAVEGESAWIALNKVAADKREVFEKFIHEVIFDKAIELGGLNGLVIKNIRILHPANTNEDGSYTYVFMADPVILGVNYDIMNYLVQVYGEEEAKEKMKMFSESLVEPQTLLELTQSKH